MKNIFYNLKIMPGLVILLCIFSCKVPFDPKVDSSDSHSLVVEGFINGNGTTTIKLSRTRNITWGDTAAYRNELGAVVEVQDQNNNTYPLAEKGGGSYAAGTILNPSGHYRLHIRTRDNKEYLSDFVDYKLAPPIDKAGWNFKDQSVQVYVNTHDPQNRTWYYRWDYTETWEFHSMYYSNLTFDPVDTVVVNRSVPVYTCWRSQSSNNILTGSSARLTEDVINQAPLVLIPYQDNRISVLYSILVNQYALDSSAYNYWNAIKSNTENVGSIFDAQPNQTRGNIRCTTDTSQTVIGYIGAGSIEQTRLFINHSEMPGDWYRIPTCSEIEVVNFKDSLELYFGQSSFVPYLKDSALSGVTKGYFAASGNCVDCTLLGTNIKPGFWP
jgi:hypothetical protein